MNVHALPDRRALDAGARLMELTSYARSLQVFGKDVDFDAPVWDPSETKKQRRTDQQTNRFHFTRLHAKSVKQQAMPVFFEKDFADLIKSMITLREWARPTSPSRHKQLICAARALYESLENRDFDPALLLSEDFIAATQRIKNRSNSYKYNLGRDLQEIAAFINKNSLAKARLVFSSPFSRGRDDVLVDDESRKKRADKMPSEEVIDAVIAMTDIVRNDGEDRDILSASIIELLMCAPWRINELLNIKVDCIRIEFVTDAIDPEKRIKRLGIAYGGSKGAPDSIKGIPTAMMPVAERALNDIPRSSSARSSSD